MSNLACNCVLWARSQVPSLPMGLTTLAQKKAIINSQVPTVGSVAICDVGTQYGHVSVVRKVVSDSVITVEQANYTPCKITWATGTRKQLGGIIGYFRPRGQVYTPPPQPAGNGMYGQTIRVKTKASVNLRTLPNLRAKVIKTFPSGMVLGIVGETYPGAWNQVQCVSGNCVWYRVDIGGYVWAGACTGRL